MHLMIVLILLGMLISGLVAVSKELENFWSYLSVLLLAVTVAYFAACRILKRWRNDLWKGRYQWITRFGQRHGLFNALNRSAQLPLVLVLVRYVALIIIVTAFSCGMALMSVGYVKTGLFCMAFGVVPIVVFDF